MKLFDMKILIYASMIVFFLACSTSKQELTKSTSIESLSGLNGAKVYLYLRIEYEQFFPFGGHNYKAIAWVTNEDNTPRTVDLISLTVSDKGTYPWVETKDQKNQANMLVVGNERSGFGSYGADNISAVAQTSNPNIYLFHQCCKE